MKKLICASLCLYLTLIAFSAWANDSTDVKLSFAQQRINENEVVLTIKATVPESVKLYGLQKTENDALYSTITFDSSAEKYLTGSIVEQGMKHSMEDPSVEATVSYFSDSVLWLQKIKAGVGDSLLLKGAVSYLYKKGEEYLPGEQAFKFFIEPQRSVGNGAQGGVADKSLLWIFLTAFGGGLLALLTPCVYPVPLNKIVRPAINQYGVHLHKEIR